MNNIDSNFLLLNRVRGLDFNGGGTHEGVLHKLRATTIEDFLEIFGCSEGLTGYIFCFALFNPGDVVVSRARATGQLPRRC